METADFYQLYTQHPVITTDSRECPEGSIFFALKGDLFDGNKFALAALEKGCAFAVVDDKAVVDEAQKTGLADRLILVEDVLQTFKNLAREHRRHFRIPVIGITGTNGKTTTKELIAAVLGEKYNVMCTQGNFNNDIGVPKTLFRLSKEHEIAVVEMGASHPGDIKTLAETTEPDCGLITNVGHAHLQGFGSFDGVKRTKGELYDYLAGSKEQGAGGRTPFAFVNTHDSDLVDMARSRGLDTVAYAEGRVAGCDPYLTVELDGGQAIHTKLIGDYNCANVLAAVTVGRYFGVADSRILHALENYTPSNNRSQLVVTERNQLIVDAYNANPTSMAAAIANFRAMNVGRRKMAILGDMRELGATSHEEHQKIADILADAGLDEVWLVGEEFMNTTTRFRCFNDINEVKAAIGEQHPEGFCILIKGSNGIKLYQLPEIL